MRQDEHGNDSRWHDRRKISVSKETEEKVIDLFNKGIKGKDIAVAIGITRNYVYQILNQKGLRLAKFRTGEEWTRLNVIRGNSCLVCGFDRYVEMCHIIPEKQGGTFDPHNVIPLCPNHHVLFDSGGLTTEETKRLIIAHQGFWRNYAECFKKTKQIYGNGSVGKKEA